MDWIYRYCNQAFAEIKDYRLDATIGQSSLNLFPQADVVIGILGYSIVLIVCKIFTKISKNLLTNIALHCILNKSVAGATKWNLSSAGRASALQAEGHRFEPYRFHSNFGWSYGEIAQLARACGSYPQCRGFESPSRY